MIVQGRANSINVQKVMWISAELGFEVDRKDVGGAFGGNDQPEYLAKNPTGLVPTLEADDLIIWESHSIVRYLAEKSGMSPWWPALIEDRAHANQWMDFYLTSVHPHMTVIFWTLVRTAPEDRDMEKLADALKSAAKQWAIVDAHLAEQSFLTGSAPTMGDVPLGCAAYRWHNMDIERPNLPNLKRWYEELASRSSYKQHVMLPLT